ncbi:MAG: hypothetical protein PHY95_02840 [Candidatus ainarchaeum sp.]|nr:hypothetical protein [Candidatus ainarchaeum sp.]
MKRILFVLVLGGLLVFAGCCGYTLSPSQQQSGQYAPQEPPPTQKLPSSFCRTLSTDTVIAMCNSAASNQAEDDQRLRDFMTYHDTYLQSLYDLSEVSDGLSEAADAWNSATTYEERHAAYRTYNVAAQTYVAKMQLVSTHSTNFEAFLRQNKNYLDEQGFNTLSLINMLVTQRSDLSSTIYSISDNLETMANNLQLEQQEQQQNQALIQALIQLALGLA